MSCINYSNCNRVHNRPFTTKIETIILKVLWHREVSFFTMIFDNYQKSKSALIATMVEIVIQGVSTRKSLMGVGFDRTPLSNDSAIRALFLKKRCMDALNEAKWNSSWAGKTSRSSLMRRWREISLNFYNETLMPQ